jgi:hypothetical protein
LETIKLFPKKQALDYQRLCLETVSWNLFVAGPYKLTKCIVLSEDWALESRRLAQRIMALNLTKCSL